MMSSGPLSGQAPAYFALFANLALAALQNITVDDALVTGSVVPRYIPNASYWNIGNTCTTCNVHPDPSMAYNGTWHDSTYGPNKSLQGIEFTFTGSALYIFFITANNIPYAATYTNVEFLLDGGDAGVSSFVHDPGTTNDFQYNVPVYVNESLASGQHSMLIQPVNTGRSVIILFDYFIYTTDTSSPGSVSSSAPATSTSPSAQAASTSPSALPASTGTQGASSGPNVGPIVGAVCGAIVLMAACLFCYRRHRRRDDGRPVAEEGVVVEPFSLTAEVAPTSLASTTSSTNLMTPLTKRASATRPPIATPQPSIPPASASASTSASSGVPSSSDPGIREQVELLRVEVAHLRDLRGAPPEYSSASTN